MPRNRENSENLKDKNIRRGSPIGSKNVFLTENIKIIKREDPFIEIYIIEKVTQRRKCNFVSDAVIISIVCNSSAGLFYKLKNFAGNHSLFKHITSKFKFFHVFQHFH